MQPGEKTVCGCVEHSLHKLTKRSAHVVAAGRTDRGVHALGQVLHVDLSCSIELEQLRKALNQHLIDQGVTVLTVEEVDHSFHARFDAISRVYEYTLGLVEIDRLPLALQPWVWAVDKTQHWQATLLRRALKSYVGSHDFRMFMVGYKPGFNAVRVIRSVELDKVKISDPLKEFRDPVNLYRVRIEGSGFLRQMVRLMVAAAVEVAQGRLSLEQLTRAIDAKQSVPKRYAAPPHGLVLRNVIYKK